MISTRSAQGAAGEVLPGERAALPLLLRSIAGLLLAAAGGVLLTLAYPPLNLWPLVFCAFVPVIVAQYRVMPRRISGLAYGTGFALYFQLFYGPLFAGTTALMEWLPLIVFVIATLASNGDVAFSERTGYRWFVLQGAVVWVAIEAIRGFVPFIGTGGFVAYPLWRQTWLIQPVSVFSIYGLSLLVMLVNYSLGYLALAWLDGRRITLPAVAARLEPARNWVAGIALAAIVWALFSLALLPGVNGGRMVTVAAAQPGSGSAADRQAQLFAQTRNAAQQGAQLVVWPEGALGWDLSRTNSDAVAALARESGAYLAVGHAVRTDAGLKNEVTLVAPDGRLLGTYGKDHPVVWAGETSLTRGSYPTYSTELGTLATIICYDLNFTDTSRKLAAAGAQLIAVSSNDSSAIGAQQPSNLVFRAVENRVALVKADTAHDSAVIAPSGELVSLAASSEPRAGIVLAQVPLLPASQVAATPLLWLGDWVGWLCIAGLVVSLVGAPLSRGRGRERGN